MKGLIECFPPGEPKFAEEVGVGSNRSVEPNGCIIHPKFLVSVLPIFGLGEKGEANLAADYELAVPLLNGRRPIGLRVGPAALSLGLGKPLHVALQGINLPLLSV